MNATWCQTWVLLVALVTVGCGGPGLVPVSGRVLLDGQPLEDAAISFSPLTGKVNVSAGPGSYGRTDAEGQFTLSTIDNDRPGAVPGKHLVMITTCQDTDQLDDSGRLLGERVPARWSETGDTYEVPTQGTAEANFELTSDR